MPLSVDNIIQSATGDFESASSGTVSLANPTVAGSTVIICAAQDGDHSTGKNLGIPTGFAAASTPLSGLLWNQVRVYTLRNGPGGQTSWSLPLLGGSGTRQVVWAAFELLGVGVQPYDVPSIDSITRGWFAKPPGAAVTNADTAVASLSSGITGVTACYDVLGLSVHAATGTDTTVPVFSGRTNNWQELVTASRANATRSLALSVGILPSIDVAKFESTLSVSPSSYMSGYVVMLYADGAKFVPDYAAIFGAEIGTGSGLDSGSITVPGTAPWDTVTGTPAITTTTPRSGSYCTEHSAAAAAECITWTEDGALHANTPDNTFALVGRFCFLFPSTPPAADTELFSVEAGAVGLSNGVTIWYRAASGKLGVTIGAGTEVLSDAAVAADTWVGVDFRYHTAVTNHLFDWQVDYDSVDDTAPVVQAQAVGASTFADNITVVRQGWSTAHTATVRYDDVAVSKIWGCYPIGDVRILPLKIDPAGTPTVVGTEANFKVFTNNGSMATWTAAGTRTALDDIPPTTGATADGLAQVAVATADRVRLPMQTYLAAPDFVLRAVRHYIAGWAASGNPGSLLAASSDGTDQLMAVALADHGFDSSALRWLCGMHKDLSSEGPYVLTQAKLDAMYLEVGGSDDANPDVGVHAVLSEVAITPAQVLGIADAEGGAFTVYVRQDPISGAPASYLVTTPAGTRGATFATTINGVDSAHYVGPNTTWELPVGAANVGEVTSTSLIPDPTT